MSAAKVSGRLREFVNPEKRDFYPKFFRAGKGGYGEGDSFLGVVVPDQRKVAREFWDLSLEDGRKLLVSQWHEERLTALFILVKQFEKGDLKYRKAIYDLYFECLDQVNNWDLVDASAHVIVGGWHQDRSRRRLHQLADSPILWRRRIAMIATFHYIRQDDFDDAIAVAEKLVADPHDLIHKAVGWMLREIGKRDQEVEKAFLDRHAPHMPRTMLRYAIEKFPEKVRKEYLSRSH